MKNDKLKFLLTQVEVSDSTEEDELISLNDELAENLIDVYGSANGVCVNNAACSNNGVCYANPSCVGNSICTFGVEIMDAEVRDAP